MTSARQIARKRVQEELRAHGHKPQDYTSAAVTRMAEDYVRVHLEQAAADLANFPEFAQWLNTERRP